MAFEIIKLTNVAWTKANLHAKCHLDSSSSLATIDMGRKLGRGLCPFLGRVELGVTGQLADTPTRGLPTRGLDISRTGQLAD